MVDGDQDMMTVVIEVELPYGVCVLSTKSLHKVEMRDGDTRDAEV